MALPLSQFIWGFELFDQGASQNNLIHFKRPSGGTAFVATLNAGVYTADELATEVARAMNVADNQSYACSFDYSALKFTIQSGGGSPPTFDLMFGTNSDLISTLLGYSETDHTGAHTSYLSDASVGSGVSTAKLWTALEPQTKMSPVLAQALGNAAKLTQRRIRALQNVTDGQLVETIYIGTLKKVQIEFRALTSSEQTNMEAFLDWAVAGKRFTWQPDSTSTNLLKLVLASPAELNDDFEWMARSEVTYGMLTFYEQLS